MKKNIAVIFGGENCEHDISIITAHQVINSLDVSKYNVIPIYIDKDGLWKTGKELFEINNFFINLKKLKNVCFVPNSSKVWQKNIFNKYKPRYNIDVVFICLHGRFGEDGTVASVLELSKIPYVNSAVLGSSVACNKIAFKYYVKGLEIPSVDFISFSKIEYNTNFTEINNKIISDLNFPVIIKPANLGSSIGVNVAYTNEELIKYLNIAFELDNSVLVEKFVENFREINVAIFESGGELIVSELEEPIKSKDILDFSDKYLNHKDIGNMSELIRIMPPNLKSKIKEEIINYAKIIYNKLELFGVVRFDFIVTENFVYVCEVNTIPGSYAHYLFKPKRLKFQKLLDIQINEAILRQNNNNKILKKFDSQINFSSIFGNKIIK